MLHRLRQLSLFAAVSTMLLIGSNAKGELILRLNDEAISKSPTSDAAPVSRIIAVQSVRPISIGEIAKSDFESLAPAKQEKVMRAPGAPGSLQLMLSALMSVGAWQVTRFAGKVHFTAPDWYHTGGPVQVGHVTPFDLVVDSSAVLQCFWSDTTLSVVDFAPTVPVILPQDEIPETASPRGPPRH